MGSIWVIYERHTFIVHVLFSEQCEPRLIREPDKVDPIQCEGAKRAIHDQLAQTILKDTHMIKVRVRVRVRVTITLWNEPQKNGKNRILRRSDLQLGFGGLCSWLGGQDSGEC